MTFSASPDTSVRLQPIRPWVRATVFFWMLTSGIVMFEPAPFDIFFVFLFTTLLVSGQLCWPRSLSPACIIGGFLFLQANLISIVLAQDAVWAIRFASITFYLLFLWFMMTSLLWRDGKAWAELIFNAYLAAAFFSAIIAILAALHALPGWEVFMRDEWLVRVKSTFKDPNVFGPFLVPAVLICIRSIFFLKIKIYMHSGLLIVFLIGILITFSRGAWITLATSVFFFVFLYFLWNKNLISFLIYILVGIIAVLIALPAMYWVLDILNLGEVFTSRLSLQRYDHIRFSRQYFLLEVFLDRPWWGIGPGQSKLLAGRAAHSLYVAALAEYGLLGIVGISMFFVTTVWRGIRSILSGKEDGLIHSLALSIILGILVNSIAIDTLHWRHFFIFLAFPWGHFPAVGQFTRPRESRTYR